MYLFIYLFLVSTTLIHNYCAFPQTKLKKNHLQRADRIIKLPAEGRGAGNRPDSETMFLSKICAYRSCRESSTSAAVYLEHICLF